MISSSLYQRGLHELGAGAQRPARRRGESGPAPSGLEVSPSFGSRTEELSQVSFKFQGYFSSWCRRGWAEAWCLAQKAPLVHFPGEVVGTLNPPPIPFPLQATLLLSFLWMPALLPVASRLLLLPRALLSMASGSPPSQPPPASGSGYVPGSVSAAFVTCPNEKVAKEIARWGPRPDDLGGRVGDRGTPGRAHSDLASPSGQW